MASGTFISLNILCMKRQRIVVMIKHKTALATILCVTERRTPISSLAPKRCAVITHNPPVKPKETSNMVKNIGAEAPAAAKALTPKIRPTMMISDFF